jgi:hypothetical protein
LLSDLRWYRIIELTHQISGCDTPVDIARMHAVLLPIFCNHPKLSVVNDAHLLGGPLLRRHAAWGIAVIAGTGSVVVGLEVENGEVKGVGRRGGVGYLLGDDGSGECSVRTLKDKANHQLLTLVKRPSDWRSTDTTRYWSSLEVWRRTCGLTSTSKPLQR